jgi:hypothetical protein
MFCPFVFFLGGVEAIYWFGPDCVLYNVGTGGIFFGFG